MYTDVHTLSLHNALPILLDLREAFEPVRKFIVDLRGAQIALAREDQRAAGALVITVTVGQKIARIAIVGVADLDRFAGLHIGAERHEHAIAVETVARRAFARKDPAGDEAAEEIGRAHV